jgi:hypothetical protein
LEKHHVVNTMTRRQIEDWLRQRRHGFDRTAAAV